ncbi:hypothetical protein M413DRAFT_20190 [Hebeloma cylindrosporum]|uniref:Uncharacterized protein n=1 Tax=Hebeloma cylindrosporum TaxID=76867 RepID=A0A0C3C2W7_HEBCY|nr:hypothetical protein M413DRAFT_20190 [Hebeloma cylindrosporum h7]
MVLAKSNFNIPSVRCPQLAQEEIVQLVVGEVERDVTQNNGPNYVKAKLKDHDIKISCDTIRKIMQEYFQGGPVKRYLGQKKPRVNRQPLSALGPYHEVAADGHEKTAKMDVVPDCRSAGAVGHLYLDLLEQLGEIPMQLNLDKGSKIGWQIAFQIALRCVSLSKFSNDILPYYSPDIHNIIIEALWQWHHEKAGHNLHLFYWIFVLVVQAALDEFCTWWNQRTVHWQSEKDMPSGHVPDDAASHSSSILCWAKGRISMVFSADFESIVVEVYQSIGSPELSLLTAWSVFTKLSDVIESCSRFCFLKQKLLILSWKF